MEYNFRFVSGELKGLIEPATRVSHRFDSPLGFRVFSNAEVAPYVDWTKSIGCVIDKDGKVIKDSECFEWKENDAFYDTDDCLQECHRVIYLGFLLTGFGHSYTDNLRKLWFLKTKEGKAFIQKGYELVYTTSWNRPISQAVMDVFQLAGHDLSNARHITRLTRFEEVIIPDNCFRASDFGRIYCQEYVDQVNCIKRSVPDPQTLIPKVYYSRTKFTNGSVKERGEKEIEAVFRKLGYVIIIPEDYSVVEQIQMVRGCNFFAATDGSVAHLSLFCKPNTNVVIVNKANYLNYHQVMINEFADLKVTYLEAHHSSKANKNCPWWGPFYLCISRYVEDFVGRPVFHLPYWIRGSYWEYSRNILYRCYNRTRKVLRKIASRSFSSLENGSQSENV